VKAPCISVRLNSQSWFRDQFEPQQKFFVNFYFTISLCSCMQLYNLSLDVDSDLVVFVRSTVFGTAWLVRRFVHAVLPSISQQTSSGQGLVVATALNPAEKISFSPLISNAHSVVYTDAEGQVLS